MTDTADRPKGRSLKPLRALLPYIQPYTATLALAMLALLLASAAQLSFPVALRYLIDGGMAADAAAGVDQYFIGLLFAAVVFGVFAALRFYLVSWLGERVVADMRDAVYRRVIGSTRRFFEVTKTGEVLSRLTTDTTLIQSIAGAGLSIRYVPVSTFLGSLMLLV